MLLFLYSFKNLIGESPRAGFGLCVLVIFVQRFAGSVVQRFCCFSHRPVVEWLAAGSLGSGSSFIGSGVFLIRGA